MVPPPRNSPHHHDDVYLFLRSYMRHIESSERNIQSILNTIQRQEETIGMLVRNLYGTESQHNTSDPYSSIYRDIYRDVFSRYTGQTNQTNQTNSPNNHRRINPRNGTQTNTQEPAPLQRQHSNGYTTNNEIRPQNRFNNFDNITYFWMDPQTGGLTEEFNSFMEPVPIRPTQGQIHRATEIVRYDNIENPTNQSCPISMTNFQPNDRVMRIRHCGHIFGRASLEEWFRQNVRCPMCRFDIRNTRRGNTTNNPQTSNPVVPPRTTTHNTLNNSPLSSSLPTPEPSSQPTSAPSAPLEQPQISASIFQNNGDGRIGVGTVDLDSNLLNEAFSNILSQVETTLAQNPIFQINNPTTQEPAHTTSNGLDDISSNYLDPD